MAKLRHIALSVKDPWKTAEFYEQAFDMKRVGETDSELARGVYVSDGVITMALLA
ncbi:MAG: VOC family protein, partial [Rhodospirillaceae bacterium]|nr:VOC family protein [Rhodospirillaceae bacterium]